jgi:hypothetical protein
MLSSTTTNKSVIEMYKGKAYIETVITLRSPLDKNDDFYKELSTFMIKIEPTMKGLNSAVEDIIMETFDSDIVSIYSGVKNL